MRLISTSLIALTLAATLLGACARRTDIPISNLGDDDDAICRGTGAAVGSPEYASCRKDRDVQRSNAIQRADRAQRNLGEYMLNNPNRP
jgi:hypothetical protein